MIGELHIISDSFAFFLSLDYSFLSSWAIKTNGRVFSYRTLGIKPGNLHRCL